MYIYFTLSLSHLYVRKCPTTRCVFPILVFWQLLSSSNFWQQFFSSIWDFDVRVGDFFFHFAGTRKAVRSSHKNFKLLSENCHFQ